MIQSNINLSGEPIVYFSLLRSLNDNPEYEFDTENELLRYHDRNEKQWNYIITFYKDINMEKLLGTSQIKPIHDINDSYIRKVYELD